ncbi:MAG: 5-(carboxyamino)imidazole ribonucleotide synthase [Cocleimonas sp.]|nr:5-(carboxyamino)imidazole ribonucleotide synthase [Cocleimonas sp.]
MILPNAMIGMLGGGQLGRLFITAAHNLGYKVMVLDPDPDSPAGLIADQHFIADYDDPQALEQMGVCCEVITTEFENIPAAVLQTLSSSCLVHPKASALEKAQDRRVEKAFILSCSLLPVPYGDISTYSDIGLAVDKITFPALMKTARFGYDGKGQCRVDSLDEVKAAYANFNQQPCVLEQQIDLQYEISVILARNTSGESQCFPVPENQHVNGILHQSIVPAGAEPHIVKAAQVAAQRIADKLEYIGVLAVEFFVTQDNTLFVNEIAPRTHNSGHYTLDACITSQFEQQVRAICGLPFGDTSLLSPVVMTNLLGDLWDLSQDDPALDWTPLLTDSCSKLHLYAKQEPRKGRKMGHFNTLAKTTDIAKHHADQVFDDIKHALT